MKDKDIKRFWEYVHKGSSKECWLWIGTISNGYGILCVGGKNLRAHRISWELKNGPITKGLFVLHRCDVPACVNPNHLFVGTQIDNIIDMHEKGRRKYDRGYHINVGADHPMAKLTPRDVRDIRAACAAGRSQCSIAAEYGIHQVCVSLIKRHKRWAHVTDET